MLCAPVGAGQQGIAGAEPHVGKLLCHSATPQRPLCVGIPGSLARPRREASLQGAPMHIALVRTCEGGVPACEHPHRTVLCARKGAGEEDRGAGGEPHIAIYAGGSCAVDVWGGKGSLTPALRFGDHIPWCALAVPAARAIDDPAHRGPRGEWP
eukprot:1177016-Prorocentrum_minimum.AAC.1